MSPEARGGAWFDEESVRPDRHETCIQTPDGKSGFSSCLIRTKVATSSRKFCAEWGRLGPGSHGQGNRLRKLLGQPGNELSSDRVLLISHPTPSTIDITIAREREGISSLSVRMLCAQSPPVSHRGSECHPGPVTDRDEIKSALQTYKRADCRLLAVVPLDYRQPLHRLARSARS